jgi:mannonate dehydratase
MITIRSVTPIVTAPAGINLVVVKVDTSEPGLYGLGCATFTQRYTAVATAVKEHLEPLMIGRDVDRIEENWQLMYQHSYWRNGPVLNNAISGVDQALWDIKAKRANMPLYQLLGGKVREAAPVYAHAGGSDMKRIEDMVSYFLEMGITHIRIQKGGYGGGKYDAGRPDGALEGAYYHPGRYVRENLKALEHVRTKFGEDVEILHDIHERLKPSDAVQFAKLCEPLRLFFLEDALAPEDIAWFENIRRVCATPLAMGELFVHPNEWVGLVSNRLIDFIRMHISTIGGLTPARKAAILAEAHGVRTAWHGPGDVSPVGHAVNLHLDLVSPNFGIQEYSLILHPELYNETKPERLKCLEEVFPGSVSIRRGYIYPSDKPGHGVDIDLEAAKKYPPKFVCEQWTQSRLPDGCLNRP